MNAARTTCALPARPRPPRTDHGAAAVTTVAVAGLGVVLALALMAVTIATLGAAHRTADAADLTALAVLSGSILAGGDGEPDLTAGRDLARRMGVRLDAIDTGGWPVTVVVRVSRPPPVAMAGLRITAEAAAQLHPPAAAPTVSEGRRRR